MSISTPHDHFFRESFSRPEILRNYCENYLPVGIVSLLDLDSLNPDESTFIDEDLHKHQSDLLINARIKDQPLNIYLLFEHKSSPDPAIGLQLLRYQIRIWEKQMRDSGRLVPIVPLVFYHGERSWRIPTQFEAIFVDLPDELLPHIPKFEFLLHDLSPQTDAEIKGSIWLRVCLSIFHAIFSPTLRQDLPELVELLVSLMSQETGVEYLRTILYYLSGATQRISQDDLKQAVKRLNKPEGDKIIMTIAEEWMQEGEERKAIEIAQRLLAIHNVVTVSELTGLSLEVVEKLAQRLKAQK